MNKTPLVLTIFVLFPCSCQNGQKIHLSDNEQSIRTIHQNYVEGWKNMDEELILSLFEENARIQPNTLAPIEGKENIRAFWFPNDGSTTTILDYKTKLLHIDIRDTLAISTQTSYLDWDYQKDSTQFGMIQRGVGTAVYRKQADNSWKIWRLIWTDIYKERK